MGLPAFPWLFLAWLLLINNTIETKIAMLAYAIVAPLLLQELLLVSECRYNVPVC